MFLDETDKQILSALRQNSRLQWKELGERVHLTGQAAADRVRRLEDAAILKAYTISIDEEKLGNRTQALIHVFLNNDCHSAFQDFIRKRDEIRAAHRISGHGCYILEVILADSAALNALLDDLLPYGNYQLNLSIQQIK